MKPFYGTLAVLLLCALSARSQETPSVPREVTLKLADLSSAVTLTSAQQTALAAFFAKEEAAIASLNTQSLTAGQADAAKKQLLTGFRAILTTQQLAAYSAKKPGSPYAVADTLHSKRPSTP